MALILVLLAGRAWGEEKAITILHTNDIHGAFDIRPATWRDDRAPVGGFSMLGGLVENIRQETARSLLLDAGDFMTGNPICDLEVDGVLGGHVIRFMNEVGYDLLVPGNHEFDQSFENAAGLLDMAEFPVVCANLVSRDSGALFAPAAYHIFEIDGLRVGVIGLMLRELAGVTIPGHVATLRVLDEARTAQLYVDAIDDETDLIVLVTHMGVDADRLLAGKLTKVDVIVGGHSHTRLKEPEVENGILIVQAGSKLTNLGRLDLIVENDAVKSYQGRLIDLADPPASKVASLEARAARIRGEIEAHFGVKVGNAREAFERDYYQESPLGTWVAEQLRLRSGADFGAMNSGGLRKNLEKGEVTKLDLYEICPFSNLLVTFECRGSDIETIARSNARAMNDKSHGILQVAGLSFTWWPDPESSDGISIRDLTVGGKPVERDRVYIGATNSFVIEQGSKYLGFIPESTTRSDETMYEVLLWGVERQPEISPAGSPNMVRSIAEMSGAMSGGE